MSQTDALAKEYFYKKEYQKALEIFIKNDNKYAIGLCYLLLDDTKNAKKYWQQDKKQNPAAQWGLCVLDLINLKRKKQPKFFQTRAFLEIYLNLFLENKKIEWAENLISCCDFLYASNPEVYKFIARALFSNGYFDLAIAFCKRTLKLFYSDPEAFLILSQCQYLKGNLGEALDSINRTLDMVNDYYPAIIFQKIIKEDIEKRRKN